MNNDSLGLGTGLRSAQTFVNSFKLQRAAPIPNNRLAAKLCSGLVETLQMYFLGSQGAYYAEKSVCWVVLRTLI